MIKKTDYPLKKTNNFMKRSIHLNDEHKIIFLFTYFHEMTEKETEFITGIDKVMR